MANRIVASPDGLKLSRAGQNVLTVADNLLLFNSSSAGAAKFIRGSVAGSRSGAGTTTHTINYGKTFTVKPFLMTNLVAGSGWMPPGSGTVYPIKGFGDISMPMSDLYYGSSTWMRFEARVGLSSVVYKVISFGGSVTYNIDYQVLDYRLGF